MKAVYYLIVTFFLAIAICVSGCSYLQRDRDIIFQASTIDALLEGVYDGETTFEELKEHGDFGIGTFNGLDGEMIGLNGRFYQIKADGVAYPVSDSTRTPFAVVTFFEPDRSVFLEEVTSYEQLRQYLDNLVPTKNIFYAVRINGFFDYIKARSVPKQDKPYPPLVEVVKAQEIFEFHNIEGTIAGFYCPDYAKGINVPGYHLHFITEDKRGGGHLLECRMQNIRVELDETNSFFMVLPESGEFYRIDLTKERQKELEKVER